MSTVAGEPVLGLVVEAGESLALAPPTNSVMLYQPAALCGYFCHFFFTHGFWGSETCFSWLSGSETCFSWCFVLRWTISSVGEVKRVSVGVELDYLFGC